jgi:Family of unknown function (DUF6370)
MKKKLAVSSLAGLLFLALAVPSFAAEKGKKEVTITGEAKCAKCALKETDKCQNVIETTKADGTKVKYYVAKNELANDFHENVCKEPKKVKATGTVKEVDGKKQLTASKIELAQ